MAITVPRTPWIDDDGTGTTGTVINNAEKTLLYNQIDAAFAQVTPGTTFFSPTLTAGGAAVSPAYNRRGAMYARAAQFCFVQVEISLNAPLGAGSGPIAITGFPLAPAANPIITIGPPLYCQGLLATPAAFSWVAMGIVASNPTIQLFAMRNGYSTVTVLQWADLVAPVELYGSVAFMLA